VHIDLGHPRVCRDRGELLFRAHGGTSDYLEHITGLLQAWSAGEAGARDEVFERMYAQLKRLAIGALRAQAG